MNRTKPDSHAADASHQKAATCMCSGLGPCEQPGSASCRVAAKAEATTTRFDPDLRLDELDVLEKLLIGSGYTALLQKIQDAILARTTPRVWSCSCGAPLMVGVLHRVDRQCYRVEA